MTATRKRETASARRAREAREQVEKQLRWLGIKDRRMLITIARAQELGFEVRLETLGIDGENVRVTIVDPACLFYSSRVYTMQGLEEWEMVALEQDLNRIQEERDAEAARARRRQELLDRLTDEERDLLGI